MSSKNKHYDYEFDIFKCDITLTPNFTTGYLLSDYTDSIYINLEIDSRVKLVSHFQRRLQSIDDTKLNRG